MRRSLLLHEQAEGTAGGVGENQQRLVVVGTAVVEKCLAQLFGTVSLVFEFVDVAHSVVMVHVFGDLVGGPDGFGELRNLLDGKHTTALGVQQHEPVRVVGAFAGLLVAGPVVSPRNSR
jgi:hypothetical protein